MYFYSIISYLEIWLLFYTWALLIVVVGFWGLVAECEKPKDIYRENGIDFNFAIIDSEILRTHCCNSTYKTESNALGIKHRCLKCGSFGNTR